MIAKRKSYFLLLLVLFFSGGVRAQSVYNGRGVEVVNDLFGDSALLDKIHLRLTLETRSEQGETLTQRLSFKKYGDNWMVVNTAFMLLGNASYQIMIDSGEKVILLSEESAKQQINNQLINKHDLDSTVLEGTQGSLVVFSTDNDSMNQKIQYTVDTANSQLISTEIFIRDKQGKQVQYFKIRYELIEYLEHGSSIIKIDSVVSIRKRSATLLPSYSNYFLYDNRKTP